MTCSSVMSGSPMLVRARAEDVGAQVVPGHSTACRKFHLHAAFCWHAALLPLRYSHRQKSDKGSEFGYATGRGDGFFEWVHDSIINAAFVYLQTYRLLPFSQGRQTMCLYG